MEEFNNDDNKKINKTKVLTNALSIGGGIVFGALAAVPHSVQRHFGTVGSGKYQLLGNYSVAAACTGEAGSL